MAVSLSVDIRHTGTSQTNRTATATVTATVTTTGSSYNNYGPSGTYSLSVGYGSIQSPTTTEGTFSHNIPANSTTVIYQQNVTVKYDDSGKASLIASIRFDTGISAGVIRRQATFRFPDIDATSNGSLGVIGLSSAGDNHLDQSYTVQLVLPNVAGTSTIGYSVVVQSFGTLPAGGRTVGSGTGSPGQRINIPWTPTSAQYEQYIENQTSDTCTLRATFSSDTGVYFGSVETSFTLALADGYEPEIGAVTITDSSGMYESTGVLVPGTSDLTIATTATAQGGATIESVRLSFAGRAIAMTNSSGSTWTADYGIYSAVAGTTTGYVRATDSRGLQTVKYFSASTEYAVPPSFTTAKAYRYNTSTGEEDDESTTVRLEYAVTTQGVGSVASGGTLAIRYRVTGSSSWTSVATLSMTSSPYSGYRNVTGLAVENSYDFEFTATDRSGQSTTATITVGTAAPIMDFLEDKVIAMFGVAGQAYASEKQVLKLYGDLEVRPTTFGQPIEPAIRGQAKDASVANDVIYFIKNDAVGNNTTAGFPQGLVLNYFSGKGIFATGFNAAEPSAVETYSIIEPSTSNFILGDENYHVALRNGTWLQGQLASGSNTNILRMNESNQVELNWTNGGLYGRVFATLWSGTGLSVGGRLTISLLPYYNVFAIRTNGGDGSSSTAIVARPGRGASRLEAVFAAVGTDGWYSSMYMRLTASGTSLTYNNGYECSFYGDTLYGYTNNSPQITAVYGLL